MTDREIRFYNFFWLFTTCGVRESDMRVMILRFVNGLKLCEIGRLEGVSGEAVRQRIFRAKKEMLHRGKISVYL